MNKGQIRLLKENELSLTRRASEAFFRESGIEGVFNFHDYAARMANLIRLDVGVELAYITTQNEASGIIGGTISPCLFTGETIAVEQFWFVLPEYRGGPAGLQLLRAFETVARSRGASRVYVGNLWELNNEKMIRLYGRLGYRPLETHYAKNL